VKTIFDEGQLNNDPLIQYLQIKPVVRVPILPTDIIPNLLKKRHHNGSIY